MRPLTRHEDRQRARHGLTDTRSSIGDRGSNTTRTGAWPANRDNSGTRRKPGGAPAALPRPPRPVRALFRHWPDVAAARGERSPIEPISLVRRSTETPRMSKTVERPRSPVPGQLGRTEASATSIGRTGPRLRRRRHPAWPRRRLRQRSAPTAKKRSGPMLWSASTALATRGNSWTRGHLRLLQRGHQSRGDPCGSDLEARAARAEGGCGCGSWADVPYASRARGQFFDRQLAGGQCHDRCLWACGSSSPQCEWLCSWICEGAPVVQGPQFVTR